MQGSKTCTPCAVGYYAASAGSQMCLPAEPGNITVPNTQRWSPDCHPTDYECIEASAWNITIGSTGQTLCEAGTFSLGAASECTKCELGKYSAVVGADSVLSCKKCDPGSYADKPGSTVCKGCGPGQSQPPLWRAGCRTEA